MRKILSLTIVVICFIGLDSCKKKDNTPPVDPIVELKRSLTNNGSKTWKLNKLFLNAQTQQLTPAQKTYTKTYSSDGKWSDSDGSSGTYLVESTTRLKETTTFGGAGTLTFKINQLNASQMDVEFTSNQQTYRFVYAP
ncbi:MAG: hypothetical protein KGP35_06010 [Bacteroidetes bacterium]|nr:hypothetical protein [Bacteroidota bacterium]